jgi:hypothetical protein
LRPIRRPLVVGCGRVAAAGLVVSLLVCFGSLHGGPATLGRQNLVLESSTSGKFSIRGNVVGLFPGKRSDLWLTLVNRNAFAIDVTSITVRAGDANPVCSSYYLVPGRFTGSFRVRANSDRRLRLTVFLRKSAPDQCQGARFPLAYRGRAERA